MCVCVCVCVCLRSLTSPVLRLSFGLWWSLFAVICLRCPASFPLRPSPPCHPAYAAPGRGVRPCLPRGSASTAAARPSFSWPRFPCSPRLSQLLKIIFIFVMISRKKKAAGEGQEKKNKEGEEKIILGNSSGFLCVSLSLLSPLSLSLSLSTDTPPFFLGKIFWIWEEGDWQTLSLLSLSLSLSLSLGVSPSWF